MYALGSWIRSEEVVRLISCDSPGRGGETNAFHLGSTGWLPTCQVDYTPGLEPKVQTGTADV